jgi:hypothetical protein
MCRLMELRAEKRMTKNCQNQILQDRPVSYFMLLYQVEKIGQKVTMKVLNRYDRKYGRK